MIDAFLEAYVMKTSQPTNHTKKSFLDILVLVT